MSQSEIKYSHILVFIYFGKETKTFKLMSIISNILINT